MLKTHAKILRGFTVLCQGFHACTGKHSGRNALRTKLQSLGFDLAQDQLDDVFKRFKVSSALWPSRAFCDLLRSTL